MLKIIQSFKNFGSVHLSIQKKPIVHNENVEIAVFGYSIEDHIMNIPLKKKSFAGSIFPEFIYTYYQSGRKKYVLFKINLMSIYPTENRTFEILEFYLNRPP